MYMPKRGREALWAWPSERFSHRFSEARHPKIDSAATNLASFIFCVGRKNAMAGGFPNFLPRNISLSSQNSEKNEKRFETRQQEVSRSGCITLVGSFLSFAGLDFLDRSVHLLVPADHLYAMHSA